MKLLEPYGCPQNIINIIELFHDDTTVKVVVGGDISSPFNINYGMKQGCVLAPTLFTLYQAAVLESVSLNLKGGVYIRTRTAGKLFNLARLKASIKPKEQCVRELLYADDSALVAIDPDEMQEIVDCFSTAASLFELKINVSKTKLLYQVPENAPEETQPNIYVNGTALTTTDSFTYLGSAVTNTNSSDLEENRRIQAATSAFNALQKKAVVPA